MKKQPKNPVIKQTIILHKEDHDDFYRPADQIFDAVCVESVRSLGIQKNAIVLHISSTRPGKKGWHKVTLREDGIILKGHLYPSLSWQRNLFYQAKQDFGWIKMEPIP